MFGVQYLSAAGISFSSDLNIVMMLIPHNALHIFYMKHSMCITGVDLLTVGLRIFQLSVQVDTLNK